jgi:hypothetical protein
MCVSRAALFRADMPGSGSKPMTCWLATVCSSTYSSSPCSPWRRPWPEAFTAHRCVVGRVGRPDSFVDVHGAAANSLRDAATAVGIGSPHARVETIVVVICPLDRFYVAADAEHRNDRTKCLVGIHRHVRGDARHDGRFVEERSEVGSPPAAREYGGALGDGVGDVAFDDVELPWRG